MHKFNCFLKKKKRKKERFRSAKVPMHKSNNVSYIPSFLSSVKGFIDQLIKRTKKEKEKKGE
jgi:hypothetical protein